MLHNILRTHECGLESALNIANEQAVYVPDETAGILQGSKASARLTEGLIQSCWCIGWAGGQDLRCEDEIPWGQTKLASISPFQD